MNAKIGVQSRNATVVQWLARLPGMQENRGSSPGCGATDFFFALISIENI